MIPPGKRLGLRVMPEVVMHDGTHIAGDKSSITVDIFYLYDRLLSMYKPGFRIQRLGDERLRRAFP
jgi:hypothetical protein